jgi:hypothetical protein
MDTRGYGYNQIRVHIHIIMGSQIPIYYTRLVVHPVPVMDFTHGYSLALVFLPPLFTNNLPTTIKRGPMFADGGKAAQTGNSTTTNEWNGEES